MQTRSKSEFEVDELEADASCLADCSVDAMICLLVSSGEAIASVGFVSVQREEEKDGG